MDNEMIINAILTIRNYSMGFIDIRGIPNKLLRIFW